VPAAKFSLPGDVPLVEVVAASLPSLAQLEDLAIARTIPGRPELPHKEVDLDVYRDRAELARATGDLSLSASVTDLLAKLDGGRLPHGPFDPGVPKGLTLWQRLRDCRTRLDDSPGEWLQRSFEGRGRRVELNGLGFDHRRLVAGVQPDAGKFADPAIECLAFFALGLFPVRGDGRRLRARGWRDEPWRRGAFVWPSWEPLLDRWAIDALLDQVVDCRRIRSLARGLGVSALFGSVPYTAEGKDPTRAYASEQLA
ncbi:MAG: hypothetical protein ACRD0D_08790, partial [Acidimicrobiales bacterium]